MKPRVTLKPTTSTVVLLDTPDPHVRKRLAAAARDLGITLAGRPAQRSRRWTQLLVNQLDLDLLLHELEEASA